MSDNMNGAEALLKTLIDSGVEVCFANPGTSEMQLVAAIDKIPGMRPVLGLFEGVVTGAADGYGRMADKPAATLLHVGSGLSNGMANLHNAKRARTPMVNMIGDHATYHLPLDAPLTSDIPTAASLTTDWMKVCESTATMGADAAEAVAASIRGRQANLVVPADLAWTDGGKVAEAVEPESRPIVDPSSIEQAAELLLHRENCCLFLGGLGLRAEGLEAAEKIRALTDATLIHENAPARVQRGVGRPTIQRLPYLAEMATDVLSDFDSMVLAGAKAPVAFFAYPELPGELTDPNCEIRNLASPEQDVISALTDLADFIEGKVQSVVSPDPEVSQEPGLPKVPKGEITATGVGAAVANLLPENAIVSDEAITSGAFFYEYFDQAANHDWLNLTGGAIGQGLPLAVGAAIACPDRKVVNLQADGSAMYTNQALWTMARENLDVCVVLFNNSRYAILELEFSRVGVQDPGERARSMLDIGTPVIDWCHLAAGMGVHADSAHSMEEFVQLFKAAMQTKGPRLIEVVLTE